MLVQTVTCPTCSATLKLKGPTPAGVATATCPKCEGHIPLGPTTVSGDAAHTHTLPPIAQETRAHAADNATRPASGRTTPPADSFPFLAPPQQPDEIGRLGPYRVLAPIGAGGMGAVFRAEDPHLKRLVALKVMLPQYASNATAKARFLREARAQAAVEHDHVAAIFQVGEDAGVPFIAMPLLKGRTLGDALQANSRVPLAEAVRIAREMAEGLAAAHEQNLVHRDIKPGNIWLEGKRLRVKILDFGLARAGDADAADAVTQQGAVVGTPAYMSPEQARGETLDPRSDLFSLGVVLYQMLAGRQPFRAGNTTGLLIAVATENPTDPKVENPDIPPALGALTMRLLAKKPDDRPATAEAAADQLREIETGLGATGVVAVPTPVPVADAPPDPWAAIDATEPTTIPMATPNPTEKARPRSHTKLFVGVGLLALLPVVVWLAVVVLRVETENGTLVVEINDKDVEARIKNGKLVLVGADGKDRYTLTAGERNKQLEAGAYKIRVEGADGLVLDTTEFTLKKGGQVTVRVTLDPKSVAKKNDPPAVVDPDRKAAEYALSIGGTIRVNDEDRDIKALAELPRGVFRLTWVELSQNPRVTDAGLANFKGCRHITHLSLWETQASDLGLAHFNECDKLTYLYLNSTRVTDAGLVNFKDCRHLTYLSLADNRVTDAGLVNFKNCTTVIYLYLWKTQVSDVGLSNFKECRDLLTINLSDSQVSGPGLAYLKDCRYLSTLWLNGTQVGDAGLNHLRECTALTSLSLNGTRLTDAGLAGFKDCKNLTYLTLSNTQVTDAGLAYFKGCKNLTQLWLLNVTRISDAGLAHFKDCNSLTVIGMLNNPVGDKGLAHLGGRKSLNSLLLNGTRATDEGLGHFKDCKELTQLNLSNTGVTDAGLVNFTGCENLTDLYLSNVKISDRGLIHFKNCNRLTGLGFSNTPVTDEGLGHFKDCKGLTYLDLNKTKVTDVGLEYFKNCKKLTGLHLWDTKVTDTGLLYFQGSRDVQNLDVSMTKVGDKGLAVFKDCKELKTLVLYETNLTDAGLINFKGCTKLTQLWLNRTQVTDAGLANFAGCKDLTDLNLSDTQIGDAGLENFKDCKSLVALNLRQTKVTTGKIAELKKALPNCKIEW